MRVHRKNLPAQRIHQNAACHFFAYARQRQQKSFGILVAHLAQWIQSRLGDLQVSGESFFQRAESAAVARLTCFGAANDEQQFVQRVFEVANNWGQGKLNSFTKNLSLP